jgi:hypothetical protein
MIGKTISHYRFLKSSVAAVWVSSMNVNTNQAVSLFAAEGLFCLETF